VSGRPQRGRGSWREIVPEDPTRPRLFFAVPLPDEVREAIRPVRDAVQQSVADGHARIRWVRIESLHLTLRFLGPTSLDLADPLGAAADLAIEGVSPFEVRIAGAGSFPDQGLPRTLWLGIEAGGDRLAALAERLAGLEVEGVERGREDRAFNAHLTIARTDGLRSGGDAARALRDTVGDQAWSFTADRIVLYRSHLGEGPAWYEPIHETRLGG
jgi:2'-5' RNA ligase